MYLNIPQRIHGRFVGFLKIFTTYGVEEFPLKGEEIGDVLNSIIRLNIQGKYLDDSKIYPAGMFRISCLIGDLDRFSEKFHTLVWAYKTSEITTSCNIVLYNEVLNEKFSKSN